MKYAQGEVSFEFKKIVKTSNKGNHVHEQI